MSKYRSAQLFLPFLVCLSILFTQSYVNAQSPTEAEFEALQLQGKIRVMVQFEDEIDLELVGQYGEVLDVLQIINAVGCVIDEAAIDTLSNEPGVEAVIPDGIVYSPNDSLRTVDALSGDQRRALKNHMRRIRRRHFREIVLRALRNNRRLRGRRRRGAILDAIAEYRNAVAQDKKDFIVQMMEYSDPWTDWNLQEEGIAATTAWSSYPSIDGTGVTVAIIDTGVNYTLEDLNAPYYLGGWDWVNDDNDPMDDNWDPNGINPPGNPDYDFGHGTLVASILLAQGEQSIRGAAPRASYYALKNLDEEGSGTVLNMIAAIQWCMDPDGDPGTDDRVDIINLSQGSSTFIPTQIMAIEAACDAAYNAGIIIVAGSGNGASVNAAYPAACANVISVGGHNIDQELYANSNGGVDVVAPGEWVWAMDMQGETVNPQNELRWRYDGTSLATPHVAGLIALQLQYARDNNLEINNGYMWESVNHSATTMPLIPDPDFSGKGKARAPENIDLLAGSWPLDYGFTYLNFVFEYIVSTTMFGDILVPAYYIGTNMYQDVALTNNTDTLGNYSDDIENLNMTVTQRYFEHENEDILPGSPVWPEAVGDVLVGEVIDPAAEISYYQPFTIQPGLNRSDIELDFNFTGNTRNIYYRNPYASIWCPPEELNEDFVQ